MKAKLKGLSFCASFQVCCLRRKNPPSGFKEDIKLDICDSKGD